MPDPLDAVTPIDGRYAGRTAALRPYASEAALMRARVRVEAEYLIALADLAAIPLTLGTDERSAVRACYEGFDTAAARTIKRIETEGDDDRPATNHDVKAVEYFLRDRLPEPTHPWIHFGLTSEDINNLAYRVLVRDAIGDVLAPAIEAVRDRLESMADEYRAIPMLARTHGQPATPTTVGKELAVFASRLDRGLGRLTTATGDLAGKLAGASGTYAAHVVAFPGVDWRAFSRAFVEHLGLEHRSLVTQINPGDDLAAVFDAIRGVNQTLIDLDRDCWLYVSDRYLGQATVAGETGSSTMPHKVNPIDFENAEGNLAKANADLSFIADWITTSRLQRDLTDSTVNRNIGAAFAHCLLGYTKTEAGLESVVPNEAVIRADLDAHPAVLAEAIQTVLRREGMTDAYERVKRLTRGEQLTIDDLRTAIDDLDIAESVRAELRTLRPADYTGLAESLVDEL